MRLTLQTYHKHISTTGSLDSVPKALRVIALDGAMQLICGWAYGDWAKLPIKERLLAIKSRS